MIILTLVVILAIIAAAMLLFRARSRKREGPRQNFAYQPELRPVFPLAKRTAPETNVPVLPALPPVKPGNVIDGQTSVNGSLRALATKYSLDQFTIATSDGLLFASSGETSAYEDAAQYAALYASSPTDESGGIVLIGLTHQGSDLVGIARTTLQIPRERRRMIAEETQVILNWWL